ncbi:MAG: hypothetical protein V1874_15895 [Spirochaetota bacterium]
MAEEQAVKTEAPAAGEQQQPSKKKKMNKLPLDKINNKIEDLAKVNQIQSKYYKHLLDRRSELQPK